MDLPMRQHPAHDPGDGVEVEVVLVLILYRYGLNL